VSAFVPCNHDLDLLAPDSGMNVILLTSKNFSSIFPALAQLSLL